jgi:murein L,D-transpeptidase YcbB/YkuD
MKTIKIFTILVFGLLVGIYSSQAQQKEQEQIQTKSKVNQAAMADLTDAQKLMLQKQRELIKQNREKFKASLSKQQLAILENTKLTKHERQKALIASFTEAQQKMMQEQRSTVQAVKQQFKNSLTSEQIQQIRTRLRSVKNIQDNKELIDRVRDRRNGRNNN